MKRIFLLYGQIFVLLALVMRYRVLQVPDEVSNEKQRNGLSRSLALVKVHTSS